MLPIGGVNEKIEGFCRVCAQAGLDGTQGVLIPARNRRHLMLADEVCAAVAAGRFHVWVVDHVADGMALLTKIPFGTADPAALGGSVAADPAMPPFPPETVLGRAAATLIAYRCACLPAGNPRAWRRRW